MAKHIVDSSFYSKLFDGAIFDGPIRIYFAQFQEQTGLELHNNLVEKDLASVSKIKELNRALRREIYFFIYPSDSDYLAHRPPCQDQPVFITPFKSSYIVGLTENTYSLNPKVLDSYLDFICKNWLSSSEKLKLNI